MTDVVVHTEVVRTQELLTQLQADIAAARQAIADVQQVAAGSVVKSVQRGVSTPTSVHPLVVSITPVNPDKAFVNMFSSGWNRNTSVDARSVRLKSSSELEVVSYYTSDQTGVSVGQPISWEVVEFY